jgi:hypothetical protein
MILSIAAAVRAALPLARRMRKRVVSAPPLPLCTSIRTAEDNCDDAETGNAQESNGYEELPELQAVVIDRALHDELTAGPTRPTERLLKGQRAPATCPLPKLRCEPRSVTNGIRRRRRGGHATRCLWRSHISHSQDRYRRFTGRDNCRGRSYVLLAHGLRVSSPRSG